LGIIVSELSSVFQKLVSPFEFGKSGNNLKSSRFPGLPLHECHFLFSSRLLLLRHTDKLGESKQLVHVKLEAKVESLIVSIRVFGAIGIS